MHKRTLLLLFWLLTTPAIVFAQTAKGDFEYQTHMSDPIEPVNRVIWDFNYHVLDTYIYKPTTETYVDWVPKVGRKAINNFVLNLDEPSTIVNNLIQFKFKQAGNALLRFTVNTTAGLFGFIDVAEQGGIPRHRETFSNVLGHWSVPHGPYLMLPVVGPRSTRKLVGSIVDSLYFPYSYFDYWHIAVLWGLDGLEKRESLLGQEQLLEQSLDSYSFAKEAYIQYEAFKFYQNSEDIKLMMQEIEKQESFENEQTLYEFMDEID